MTQSKVLLFLIVFLVVASPVSAASVVLNEYNAVSGSNQLDGGMGADSFFGTINGNGGNWFELIVVDDNVDVRGWQFAWTEDETVGDTNETAQGVLTLSNDAIWSDLPSGTILTFIETVNAGGNGAFDTSTDLSFDPAAGDWWINVATQEEAAKGAAALVTTVTNDGATGDFSVGRDDWTLTIRDAGGNNVFGPVGEGTPTWAGGGVNSEEGGSLEGPMAQDGTPPSLATWQAITPGSGLFDDTGSTSFGMPNVDYDADSGTFTTIQDLSALRSAGPVFGNGDFNGDGQLTADDINALTAAIRDGAPDISFDVDLSGAVDNDDRVAWVEGVKRSYFGDANLDGEFNSQDLVAVLTAGEYEDATDGNSTWQTGDWNGDGDFTTSDFVTALSGGGFEIGPRAATAAVPEPSSMVLVGSALIGWGRTRRRRR